MNSPPPAHACHAYSNEGTPSGIEHEAIQYDLFCQTCGYNLRGLTGDRCPECGRSLETIRATTSLIPWVYRKKLGKFRAYWRTVWLVMFRQGRFCDEMARPVSYADAQRFRWATILHAYVPILLLTISVYVGAWPSLFEDPLWNQLFVAVWPAIGVHVCILLFLAAVTGVPGYFFHPGHLPVELQNRAIALSCYTCGPLALTAVPVAALGCSFAIGADSQTGLGLILFAILFPCGQFAAWWLDLNHLARCLMPQRRSRSSLVALCVPVLWGLAGVLTLFGLPLAVYFVVVVFASRG